MGWTSIDRCATCGHEEEHIYGCGMESCVTYCAECAAETWSPAIAQPSNCVRCGGNVDPGGEPACEKCGGRVWIKPAEDSGFNSLWD